MKKILTQLLPCLIFICLLNGCKKGFNDQQSVFPNPGQPDLSVKIQMSVAGFVTDETGAPAMFVNVTAGDKYARTDKYGYFKIANASLSKTAAVISVSKQGYFDSYRTFIGKENEEVFTRIQLVPKKEAGTISAASGGVVSTSEGSVSLPANAVVNANTNTAYIGTVHVAAHLFKHDDANEFAATAPGDNRGINSDGHLQLLQSYFNMAVELTGDNGELLQIAPGKEATISTPPIPGPQTSSAPTTIALWSFDVTKGLWKQEGTATKIGNTYSGNVSHFSFWDGAVGVPLVNLTVQVVNTALQPMANTLVGIRYTNQLFPNFNAYGYTNAQGIVSGAVFANASLTLDVLTPCNLAAYAHPFTTSNNDIDLGTVNGDFGQSMITVTGPALDCSLLPIATGRVLLYNGSVNHVIPIVNGSFNFSYLGCTNQATSYVLIDDVTHQQGMAGSEILNPGVNILDNTSGACGTSLIGTLSFSIDGFTRNYTEPADTIGCITPADDAEPFYQKTSIAMKTNNLTETFFFTFDGGKGTGYHEILGIASTFFPGGSANPVAPVQVNVTEYGNIGDFVVGSFSGVFKEFPDTTVLHTISCTFRTRRTQ